MLNGNNSVVYDSTINIDCHEIIIPYICSNNDEFKLRRCDIYKNNEDFYKYIKEIDPILYKKFLNEEREYD